MRTAGDIARRALVRSGAVAAGETPDAAEIEDAVTTLGNMLDSWSLERLVVFGTKVLEIPAAGRELLTVGPSGDHVAERPNTVVSAFMRTESGDYSLQQASTEYMDQIRVKSSQGPGNWYSYEGAMPDGVVRLWPVPAHGVLHLRVTGPVVVLEDINDELDLPPGWYDALVLSLAMRLCEEYGFAVTEVLATQAAQAKANIKRANIRPQVATFDIALAGGRRSGLAEFNNGY